jgi:hypothetical protein
MADSVDELQTLNLRGKLPMSIGLSKLPASEGEFTPACLWLLLMLSSSNPRRWWNE